MTGGKQMLIYKESETEEKYNVNAALKKVISRATKTKE